MDASPATAAPEWTPDAADWKEEVLRGVGDMLGAALLVGAALVLLLSAIPLGGVAAALAAGGLFSWGSTRIPAPFTWRAAAVLALMSALAAYLIAEVAWAPGVVLLTFGQVLFGGLLLGSRGAAAMTAANVALLAGGWAAARQGWTFPKHVSDMSDDANWLLIAGVFGVSSAGYGRLVGVTLRVLTGARARAQASLAEAQRERSSGDEVRREREVQERALRDAQRQAAVVGLSNGAQRVLGEVLAVLHQAIGQLGQAPGRPARREVGDALAGQVARTAVLLRALMLLGRQESGKAGPVWWSQVIAEVAGPLRESLPTGVTLTTHLEDTRPVRAEAAQLRGALLALLMNAREAVGERGRIILRTADITTGPLAGGVVLWVDDDGPGWPSEVWPRVTEAFFTTKDPEGHPGLGLFVASSTVARWGGHLEVQGAPGGGARVGVSLPGEGAAPPAVSRTDLVPIRDPGDRAWQEAGLRQILVIGGLVSVVIGAYIARFTPVVGVVHGAAFVLSGVGSLLCGGIGWLPHRARLYLTTFNWVAVPGVMLLRAGFMQPLVVAVLLGVVFVPAVFGDLLLARLVWVATVALFLAGAWGPWTTPLWLVDSTEPTDPANWQRVVVLMPLIHLAGASVVLHATQAAEGALRAAVGARDALTAERARRLEHLRALEVAEGALSELAPVASAGRRVGGVLHDLANTLSGVSCWAEVLQEDESIADTEMDQARQALIDATLFAESLALQLGADESGAEEPVVVGVEDVVRDLVPMLRRRLGPGVAVLLDLRPGCRVRVSPADLGRLLVNLAVNGGQAMPNGGALHLRCRVDADRVVLEVQDDGTGMDEATRRRLFEPYFTTRPHGTGLGLQVVQRVARGSGASIDVWSELGRGARFSVRWPLAPAVETAATAG